MFLVPTLLALSVLAPQKPERQKRPKPPPPPKVARILCTPTSVAFDGAAPVPARNPIAEALSRALPGARIELEDGDYESIGIGYRRDAPWSAKTTGGTRSQPITVSGRGRARIVGKSDAISVSQELANGHITFENIELSPGYRSAVLFSQGKGAKWVHEGYRFIDCSIVGHWDHSTDSGETSKWGVWGQGLKDFEFRGQRKPARIVDLRREHAFYLQNLRGDVLIENVEAARLGRTFVQFTARVKEGPPSVGTITVRNCKVEDVCVANGDNWKGGSAFTIAGRHSGTVVLQGNRYRAGFAAPLRKLTREGVPYGTGALVAWDGGGGEPTARLVLADNDFEFAPGCGDRVLVSIGACVEVELRGKNRFVSGANPAALELEPITEARPNGAPVGALSIDPETEIQGPVRWRGSRLSLEELLGKYPRVSAPPSTRRPDAPPAEKPKDS